MLEFKKESELKANLDKYKKYSKIISLTRLILALNLLLWIICLISLDNYILYSILSIISFIIFLSFIFISNPIFNKLNLLKKKELVYLLHKKRRKKDFSSFTDEGRDLIDKDDYKLTDLDIFGPKSLFQYINSTRTKLGRERLAKQLKSPENKPLEFTKCIDTLSKTEKSLDIEASLLEFNANAKHISYDEFKSILGSTIKFRFIFILPLLCFIATISYLITALILQITLIPLIGLIFLNFISSQALLRNDVFNLESFKYYNLCESYYNLSNTIISLDIYDVYFNKNKEVISNNLKSLKSIKSIFLALSSRRNIIAKIILNSLFIYDLFLILIYNKLSKHISNLDDLFNAIAEIEVMISFANLGIDNDIYCIPAQSESIKAKEIYHPLVKNCIANDIEIAGGIILTGSNMSGKTTFMRTIGINQILFNAGSICLAESFESKYLNIYSSLRANDMLSEGISTFYAEILRMKRMNEAIKKENTLLLVDEIFKGTNAKERIEASLRVIDKFNEYSQLFIISTHDFELCDALNILNYHFNEEYNNNQISFDYKIKKGKCETSNALYLLRMSGIIDA